MKKKEELQTLRTVNARIDALTAERVHLRTLVEGVCSPRLSERVLSSTPQNTRSEEILMQLDEIDDEIEKEAQNLLKLYGIAHKMIAKLKPPWREVLHRRYVVGEKWDTIADALGYEKRYVRKINDAALKEYEKLNMTANDIE